MDTVSLIREKIDIVALISEFIPLKKMGRNFKAPCPFHTEKTPSFVVSAERQIWHCFGCGKGGDCYTFLIEYENLEFPEALRMLSKRTGIQLDASKFDTATSSKKDSMYQLNRLACEFYQYILLKHPAGKKALAYITDQRSINPKIAQHFSLGFSPNSGYALVDYLIKKKKHTKEDLIDSGLAVYRRGMIGDFFINRLMFALIDHRGNVVGFSGRVLDEKEAEMGSKYINTRDTLVYHKGSHFFGIHLAKDAIKKSFQAILVEGEFDVLSCVQAGISNVIAIKGTALTEQQVSLLARFSPKATLCFDADNAGIMAIKRSLPILEKKGMVITIALTPNGKDPDESVRKDFVAFKKALQADIPIYDYLISYLLQKYDTKSAAGKKQITDEILPALSTIENEIVKEHYLRKLSTELETSYESISRQIEKGVSTQGKDIRQSFVSKEKKNRKDLLESYLISLIFQAENPLKYVKRLNDFISRYIFFGQACQRIIQLFIEYTKKTQQYDNGTFVSYLPTELLSTFDTAFLFPLPKFSDHDKYDEEIETTVHELEKISIKEQIKTLSEKIKENEKIGTSEELDILQQEFNRLIGFLGSAK